MEKTEKFEQGSVSLRTAWQVQAGGFHIEHHASPRAGEELFWLVGENIATQDGAKHISRTRIDVYEPNKSCLWAFIIKRGDPTKTIRFIMYCNLKSGDIYDAAFIGCYFEMVGDLLYVYRRTGGASTLILSTTVTADTEEHIVCVSREVSGVNRFWRLFYDPEITDLTDPAALEDGPTSDATITNGLYTAWNCDERDMVTCIKAQS